MSRGVRIGGDATHLRVDANRPGPRACNERRTRPSAIRIPNSFNQNWICGKLPDYVLALPCIVELQLFQMLPDGTDDGWIAAESQHLIPASRRSADKRSIALLTWRLRTIAGAGENSDPRPIHCHLKASPDPGIDDIRRGKRQLIVASDVAGNFRIYTLKVARL